MKIAYSPIGPGTLTGWSHAGFPEVDGVAVFEDGSYYDPHELRFTVPPHPHPKANYPPKEAV